MKVTERDRRALIGLAGAAALMLVLRVGAFRNGPAVVAANVDSVPQAERKLSRLRQIAATVPGKETVLAQARTQLAAREKGILQADTAQQAQAQLLQVIRRIGKQENIDARGGEFGPVRALGDDYGEVTVAVTFECQIEQLVNLLADLTSEPELLATNEIRISSVNSKTKVLGVRLVLSGVVPRKLAPEKKASLVF